MSILILTDAKGGKHRVDSQKLIFRRAIYGVYLKNRNLLMVRDKISNNWEFPGGGVENNEPLLEALKREFCEETGLTVLDKQLTSKNLIYSGSELFFDINTNEAWKTERNFFFISRVIGTLNTQGNKEDIVQARFFPLRNLPLNQVSQTIKKVVVNFYDFIKKGESLKSIPD